MRIGFNLLPYAVGQHGGAEFYLRQVILSLQSTSPNDQIVIFGDHRSLATYSQNDTNVEFIAVSSLNRSRTVRILAEQLLLPVLCREQSVDCIVSNYVVPVFARCPKVVIVHDLLFRRYPELFEVSKLLYWRTLVPASIRVSNSIATVSQFSASEIATFYPEVTDRLYVTVEGIRPSLEHFRTVDLPNHIFQSPFLLCVATFGKHKNLDIVLQTFKRLSEIYPSLTLVFIGAARTPDAVAYKENLIKLTAQLEITQKVKFIGHVSDEVLATHYRQASALILPSLYEGFGLPIIEAQYFGCPVICSNAASLPEIIGAGGLTFDPTNEQELVQIAHMILSNAELQAKLRNQGYENVRRFSWDRAAQELMPAVRNAVSNV